MKNAFYALKSEKLIYFFFAFIILLSFRSFFTPIFGDENTYFKIATNIIKGKYFQNNYPSTVSPVIPFLMALFYSPKMPILGFILHKVLHISLSVLGFRLSYLTLKKLNLNKEVILLLLLLTSLSTGFISFTSSLYPDPIIFFLFWGFLYYYNKSLSLSNFKILITLFVLLIFSRYLFAVFGLFILIYYYNFTQNSKKEFWKPIVITLIAVSPLILWFKYIYTIESQNLSEISYFGRFKIENPLWYNIKCGLGLEKHYEAGKINGIPAFISLFIPVTGIRDYLSSSLLLLFLLGGLYINRKNKICFNLLTAFILVFGGLILAGTGFSRYWLALLPIIYLGFYYFYSHFFKTPTYFIWFSRIYATILLLNEIRLTFLILSQHL